MQTTESIVATLARRDFETLSDFECWNLEIRVIKSCQIRILRTTKSFDCGTVLERLTWYEPEPAGDVICKVRLFLSLLNKKLASIIFSSIIILVSLVS